MHSLLRRQLRKLGIDEAELMPEPGQWRSLLERVNKAYEDSDQDRYTLERALTLCSEEMQVMHRRFEKQNRILQEQHVGLMKLTKGGEFFSEGVGRVMRQITSLGARTLEVERVSVWMYRPKRDGIVCKALYQRSLDSYESGLELPADAYPSYFSALAASEIIAADDARSDPRTCEFTESYLAPLGIYSMMDIPIIVGGRLEGVLCHEQTGAPRRWTTDERIFGVAAANIVALAYNHSELERAERSAREARGAAEKAAQIKAQFLANMSHEIRTPLHGILSLTDILSDTRLDAGQSEHVRMLRSSARVLLEIVNDILDLSKIESGRMAIEKIPFDIRVIMEEIESQFGALARQKGLHLTIETASDLAAGYRGDPLRLRQILFNLVGNAVKFTSSGGVHVTVFVPGEALVGFEVKDSGIGIPKEKHASIFDPFSQADASTTRQFGGTGLGLTISRQLAELQGGRITLSSDEGMGASFRVEIPLEPAHDFSSKSGGDSHVLRKTGRPLNILAAEDNIINQIVIRRMIETFGHGVTVVGNGKDAVDAAISGKYGVLLMDVQMPVMDGLAAAREIRIREREGNGRLPIIAMTAHALDSDKELCLAAGMDDHVAKPIDPAELFVILERIAIGTGSAEQMKPTIASHGPIVHEATLLNRFSGDVSFLAEVVTMSKEDSDRIVSELRRLIDGENAVSASEAAHMLKGIVSLFESPRVAELAGRIEIQAAKGEWSDAGLALDDLADLMPVMYRHLDEVVARGMD